MLLAVYNSFTIPLQVAFHLHSMDHPVYILVDVIINIVFICDMLVNFRTTFIDEESGEEVIDPKEIAVNYLKSRFKIDLIGVLPWDDIARFWIAWGSSHSVNWIILIKMIRVLKVYDVISSLKVKEETKVAVQLVKILYLFVLNLHCHGWAWHYIVEQDESWYPPIEYWHGESVFYEGEDLFKYFNCLLHALLMFGGDDIGPATTFQIVWCWSWIFAGAMLEALLFGKFADLAMEMNKKENLKEEKQDMVNSAIKSLAIPEKLELKIEGYLAYTQSNLDFQHEFKLFYKIIPPSIRDKVIYHIFSETLKENFSIKFNSLLIDNLSQRLKVHTYSPEEEIIVQGHYGENLFVIAKGECLVVVWDHLSINEPVRILKQGDIFGEVALIQNCKRTATVKTNNFSLVASLNKKDFKDLSYQFKGFVPKLKQKMKSYDDNLKRFLISIVKIIPLWMIYLLKLRKLLLDI